MNTASIGKAPTTSIPIGALIKRKNIVKMKNRMFNFTPPHMDKCSICPFVYLHAPFECVYVEETCLR